MATPLNVLIVEDVESDAMLLLIELRRNGYDVTHERVDTADAMREALDRRPWDIVISDYSMPRFDATEALAVLRQRGEDIPLIIVSGTIGEDTAVGALQAGANDFLVKGKLARLKPAIERELREKQQRAARRRVEQSLRESESRFRRLADSGLMGITIMENSGKVVEANSAFLRMVGYSEDDVKAGRVHWRDMTPPEYGPLDELALEQLEATGVAAPWEKEYMHTDGRRVPVLIGVATLQRPQNIAVTIDLTERKRTEEALRKSDERYRKIVETTNEGVWMLDASFKTIFVNRRMVAMLGYAEDEIVGKSIYEFVQPDSRADVERDFARRLAGIVGPTEAALRRADGTELSVLIDSAPMFDASLNYEGALAMVLDISQRRRLEQQLRQAQKMEAIGSLAGGVAHDFNNILSVILSYLGMILDSLKAGDPIRADLEEIWKASESATDLTRQLLAFSRQQMLQPTTLDVNRVVLGLEKMLRRLLTEDVELSLLTMHNLGAVHADPSQIEQIVMNLVVNARDAMPKGGKVAIETANVELGVEYAAAHHDVTPGPYVMLAVTDTGVGMDAVTQARIFEPFFTTKAKGRGTGLGLSTVFGIVKQSGGHIWVYSEPGEGTTFKVYFPRLDTPIATTTDPPLLPITLEGTETILLVEDQEQVRTVIRAILRRRGYNVIEAQNGGEALLICEKYSAKIHLLLTDVVMPRMSGRELAERLAPLRPEMKVLYVSGYTENAIVHHGVLDAGVSFLQKPLTPESVARKVRQVLDAPKLRTAD
ncbi:MAG TPA: PAS domain S-box protein [Polyangiaceae bacterium]|nr:PAS domain S-box protein [Polyangiaceae bacterium]